MFSTASHHDPLVRGARKGSAGCFLLPSSQSARVRRVNPHSPQQAAAVCLLREARSEIAAALGASSLLAASRCKEEEREKKAGALAHAARLLTMGHARLHSATDAVSDGGH